jgi:hypothetical protein
MNKKYFFLMLFALPVIMVMTAKALPDKTYTNVCMEDYDIKQAVVMDVDGDDHYETMKTTWCDFDNGIEFDIISPIIYPERSKGTPINDVAHDPFPFDIRKKKPSKPKKTSFILEFFPEDDSTSIIYDYQMNEDDPNVYYTQYVPYTSVDDPIDDNGISILPNPATDAASMYINVPATTNVTISVYNQNGQIVATVNNSTLTAGEHEFSIDVSNFASGVYFVHTIAGTQRYVNSLFVVK